jgi:hypothetical protein
MAVEFLTHPVDDMREHFSYDPLTGDIINIKRRMGLKPERVGFSALRPCVNGHFYVSFRRKVFLASRFAWALHHGEWPSFEIDHRDGDTHNNKLLNLRELTSSQQKRNRKPYGKTGVKSTHIHQNGFRASLTVNKKRVDLGVFANLSDANSAVIEAEKRLGLYEYRRNP